MAITDDSTANPSSDAGPRRRRRRSLERGHGEQHHARDQADQVVQPVAAARAHADQLPDDQGDRRGAQIGNTRVDRAASAKPPAEHREERRGAAQQRRRRPAGRTGRTSLRSTSCGSRPQPGPRKVTTASQSMRGSVPRAAAKITTSAVVAAAPASSDSAMVGRLPSAPREQALDDEDERDDEDVDHVLLHQRGGRGRPAGQQAPHRRPNDRSSWRPGPRRRARRAPGGRRAARR